MAERLSEVEERIDSIQQLSSVVSAYRGIAAARLRDATERLEGIRRYADTIGDAIGQALGLVTDEAGPLPADVKGGTHLVIVLCSEQAFVANFNSRLLDEARQLTDQLDDEAHALFVVGDRGLSMADEHGIRVEWSAPMASRSEEVAKLGNRLVEALYERLGDDRISRATIIHAVPGQGELTIVTKPLIPFDYGRFALSERAVPPLVTLPLADLIAQLAEEYVFAELCEAVMLSYAAENEMRMLAMLSARTNVEKRLKELTSKARRMRQEEITAEVIELAAGTETEIR